MGSYRLASGARRLLRVQAQSPLALSSPAPASPGERHGAQASRRPAPGDAGERWGPSGGSRAARVARLRLYFLLGRQPGGARAVSHHQGRLMSTTAMTEVIALISAEAAQLQAFLA